MKFKFNKPNLREFHEKFAWKPTNVLDDETKNTYIWFERYMQRYKGRRIDNAKHDWERYSTKEYFKRKLKGEFEKTTGFAEMSHDGTDSFIQGTGSVGVKVLRGQGDVEVWDEQGNIIQSYTLDSNGNEI